MIVVAQAQWACCRSMDIFALYKLSSSSSYFHRGYVHKTVCSDRAHSSAVIRLPSNEFTSNRFLSTAPSWTGNVHCSHAMAVRNGQWVRFQRYCDVMYWRICWEVNPFGERDRETMTLSNSGNSAVQMFYSQSHVPLHLDSNQKLNPFSVFHCSHVNWLTVCCFKKNANRRKFANCFVFFCIV